MADNPDSARSKGVANRDINTESTSPNSSVATTLLLFTFAMVALPLGTYYVSKDSLFNGNATYAGALSAFMANVVLAAYVFVAWKEDQADQIALKRQEKKSE